MEGEVDSGVLRGDARMVSLDCGRSGGGDKNEEDAEEDKGGLELWWFGLEE